MTTLNRRIAPQTSSPVTLETAWNIQRVAALLVALWIGGVVIVAISAPVSFRAVDALMAGQPGILKEAVRKVGPIPMYEVLRLVAGEVNRILFEYWGWIQLGIAFVVFLQVLFFSSLRKAGVVLAGAMFLLSGVLGIYLIPSIAQIGREIQVSAAARMAGEERFRALHFAFTAFESTIVLMGVLLIVLLLGRSRLSARGNGALN